MYLTYDELLAIDPSIQITAEEWPSYALQIDALVDRLTFGIIPERGVMAIPTLAESVRRAVAVEARAIKAKGGLDKCMAETGITSKSVSVGGITESISFGSSSASEDTVDGLPVSKIAQSLLARITAIGRTVRGA